MQATPYFLLKSLKGACGLPDLSSFIWDIILKSHEFEPFDMFLIMSEIAIV